MIEDARRFDQILRCLDKGEPTGASPQEERAVREFVEVLNKPVMDKTETSRLHQLQEDLKTGRVFDKEGNKLQFDVDMSTVHSFIVKHDWGSLLQETATGQEFRMPFDKCAFEFIISGRPVIAFAWDDNGSFSYTIILRQRTANNIVWMAVDYQKAPLMEFVYNQIRAICIALEAEVAESEVVRAPLKLNQKRAKRGKPPLPDHRVVNLAKRRRVGRLDASGSDRRAPRLHFRRGHWRNYEGHRTWIKWCLVGDPDLGFVSKHYTL